MGILCSQSRTHCPTWHWCFPSWTRSQYELTWTTCAWGGTLAQEGAQCIPASEKTLIVNIQFCCEASCSQPSCTVLGTVPSSAICRLLQLLVQSSPLHYMLLPCPSSRAFLLLILLTVSIWSLSPKLISTASHFLDSYLGTVQNTDWRRLCRSLNDVPRNQRIIATDI